MNNNLTLEWTLGADEQRRPGEFNRAVRSERCDVGRELLVRMCGGGHVEACGAGRVVGGSPVVRLRGNRAKDQ